MDDFTKRLRDDLDLAAKTLRRYEALHIAKGTPESLEKAAVNAALAVRFEGNLAATAGEADLAIRALEELHQLGYVVRDGLLYPPERAHPAGGLPPHDPAKQNEQQGLYEKYSVRRTDGSDAPGGKHHGCEYFVLDTTHDKHAKAALGAYANAVAATHPQLAADMRSRWWLAAPQVYPSMPVVAYHDAHNAWDLYRGLPREVDAKPLVRQSDALAAIAARDGHMSSMRAEIIEARITIAELKADLRERDEHIAWIRAEHGAEVAALTERALDAMRAIEAALGASAKMES